jgi:hypothetical protein
MYAIRGLKSKEWLPERNVIPHRHKSVVHDKDEEYMWTCLSCRHILTDGRFCFCKGPFTSPNAVTTRVQWTPLGSDGDCLQAIQINGTLIGCHQWRIRVEIGLHAWDHLKENWHQFKPATFFSDILRNKDPGSVLMSNSSLSTACPGCHPTLNAWRKNGRVRPRSADVIRSGWPSNLSFISCHWQAFETALYACVGRKTASLLQLLLLLQLGLGQQFV